MSRVARQLGAVALVSLFLIPSFAATGENPFWQRQSIYQIITDRFYDGDPSNDNADGNYDPTGHRGTSVHGGDFKGIEEKLDYLKSLGATAIWISPVVLNARGEFHGYAGLDFYKVDPHWGTMADLRHLVQAAHARGILVIDDIVVNHGGNLVDSADPGYPDFKYPPAGYHLRFRDPARQYPPPFDLNATHPSLTNLFHDNGFIQDYHDPVQVELGELGGLDDFRTETPYVRAQMEKIYEFWIQQAGFDAFRIDTVKHVEVGFWRDWCPAIRAFAAARGKPDFFMFGEVLDHSDAKCGSYTGMMGGGPFKLDSVLDYPLYFKIKSVFAEATGGTKQIVEHYRAVSANYDPSAQNQLVTFLDNHDQPRFLSVPGATVARLKVALIFLYTAQGIPCLYYGTEQAFNGGKDPFDREDMFAGRFEWGPSLGDNFDMTHPLFQLVARLNNFRRLYPVLQTGIQSNLWAGAGGPGLFAYIRRLGTQQVFVVFNTAETNRILPPCPTIYPAGKRLQNLLDEKENLTVLAGGKTPSLAVPGTSAKIFVAKSEIRPLDPVVTGILPKHDSREISPTAPIIVRFSQPMETTSVERAFSTVPAVPGAFSWTAAGDEMTFQPANPGFQPQTMITVRIGDAARSADSGRTFYAGFESRFRCGGAGRVSPPN
ncbi:MAG TPA: alpha-amylase family glycosyl hydrolase [Candidatus Sulfopaludibacter sp.]|nr:alpha-amylase family glycosyl hydrolase [Candidatus Sulfopaludibacter sp.]